jgi:hypothetical protein
VFIIPSIINKGLKYTPFEIKKKKKKEYFALYTASSALISCDIFATDSKQHMNPTNHF